MQRIGTYSLRCMKIKLDHNLSRHLKGALQTFGHDVDTAFDEGLARSTDREVFA